MTTRISEKFLFIVCLSALAGCFRVYGQGNKNAGQEAALFLNLQHINLGTLSKREEKRQYLITVEMEKRRIQHETLRIVYENALELYRQGDYERAKELSARILAIDPGFRDAQILLESASLMRGGRLLTEREIIREKFEEGMRFYEEGRYEDAVRKWEEVLSLDPKYIEARKWLERTQNEMSENYLSNGDTAYKQGNIEHALDNWYKALDFNRGNPELTARIASAESELRLQKTDRVIGHALAYYKKGFLLKAYVSLEHALELSPGHPKASELVGEIRTAVAGGYIKAGKMLYKARQYIRAIGQWSKAALWGYNRRYVNTLIGTAKRQMQREENLKQEKIERVREDAERAAALEAKKEQERIRAELQEELKASEEAKRKILSVTEVSEESRRASEEHYLRGLVHYQNGEYEKARTEWTLAKQFNPAHTEADAGLKRIEQMYGTAR